MRYIIEGADIQTGKERAITVDAIDERDAAQKAGQQGLFVSAMKVESIEDPPSRAAILAELAELHGPDELPKQRDGHRRPHALRRLPSSVGAAAISFVAGLVVGISASQMLGTKQPANQGLKSDPAGFAEQKTVDLALAKQKVVEREQRQNATRAEERRFEEIRLESAADNGELLVGQTGAQLMRALSKRREIQITGSQKSETLVEGKPLMVLRLSVHSWKGGGADGVITLVNNRVTAIVWSD